MDLGETVWVGVVWIHLAHDRDKWKTWKMTLKVLLKGREFLV
jgi:hypothetical protein